MLRKKGFSVTSLHLSANGGTYWAGLAQTHPGVSNTPQENGNPGAVLVKTLLM